MQWTSLIPLFVIPLTLATSTPPQHILSNPANINDFTIPTTYESAIQARRILHLSPLATLSTVFPHSSTLEQRPAGLAGVPIGLTDYIADCEPSGNPTILAISIATSFKNVASGSNISISLQWTPPHAPSSRIESAPDPLQYSAANLPRFSLLGYLESIPKPEVESLELSKCFTKSHPDAKYWLPGNKIHSSEWVRLVVNEIYWIGGFGDRAYIGWIPIEEWRNVTKEEWEGIRLPGEKKGWKEWLLGSFEL